MTREFLISEVEKRIEELENLLITETDNIEKYRIHQCISYNHRTLSFMLNERDKND